MNVVTLGTFDECWSVNSDMWTTLFEFGPEMELADSNYTEAVHHSGYRRYCRYCRYCSETLCDLVNQNVV